MKNAERPAYPISNIEEAIKTAVHESLNAAIIHYFERGEGRKMIEEQVASIFETHKRDTKENA